MLQFLQSYGMVWRCQRTRLPSSCVFSKPQTQTWLQMETWSTGSPVNSLIHSLHCFKYIQHSYILYVWSTFKLKCTVGSSFPISYIFQHSFYRNIFVFFFFSLNQAGDPDGDFQLHASTGALSTSRALDREGTAEYNLEVVATDKGTPALSTTVTVNVRVLDVNDNSPVFSRSSYTVDVSENANEGTLVLEVSTCMSTINKIGLS